MDIRAIIEAEMGRQGVSQRGLAHEIGMTQQAVNRYIRGHKDMTGENLARILDALGLVIIPRPPRRKR